MIYDRGKGEFRCPCWIRGRGKTGMTYRIDIRNVNVLGVGKEEDSGSSRSTGGSRRRRRKKSRRRRESLCW